MSTVLLCTNWDSGSSTCASFAVVEDVYLLPAESAGMVELLLNGGFSPEAFGIAFSGILGLWATGLAIGFIASTIRKARI